MTGEEMPVILMGPAADDPAESVSAVNEALAGSLAGRYRFILSATRRKHGTERQARWNLWNIYYFAKHLSIWCFNLLRHRPAIAHYAVSSGPALGKGLVMLGLARLAGARTIGHLHSGAFLDRWERLSPAARRFALRCLRRLDFFVVLSERWRARIAGEVGIAPGRIRVVNNPIAPDFEREALAMPLSRDEPRVLAVGILGTDKGVFELIEASARLGGEFPAFRLDIAGPEREPGIRKRVIERIAQTGAHDRIHLHGLVRGRDKIELFQRSAIFVLPSHFENFPLVVLEAAAAGQAIVTTPVGAVPEFFEHGKSALFVEPRDPVQLAEAIARLLSDAAERERLGVAARQVFVSRLSRRLIGETLHHVYREALALTPAEAAREAGRGTCVESN